MHCFKCVTGQGAVGVQRREQLLILLDEDGGKFMGVSPVLYGI